MTDESWNEEDSELYRKLADIAVPRREAQIAALLTLLPMARDEPSRVVELGCGTGALGYAILDALPRCVVTALDGSPSMLRRTEEDLASFRERLRTDRFALDAADWHHHLDGADAVVSSLAIHHLDGEQKRSLFASICAALDERGALLIADLVAPQRPEAEELFRSTWERSAAKRATRTGDPTLYELFQREEWNVYRFPDPADKPSPLSEQLQWLRDVGFAVVDCFWLQAGHAIYGGYHSRERSAPPLDYSVALESARRAIARTSR